MPLRREFIRSLPLSDLDLMIKDDLRRMRNVKELYTVADSQTEKSVLFRQFEELDREVMFMLQEVSNRILELKVQNQINKHILEQAIKAKYGKRLGFVMIYIIRLSAYVWSTVLRVKSCLT